MMFYPFKPNKIDLNLQRALKYDFVKYVVRKTIIYS